MLSLPLQGQQMLKITVMDKDKMSKDDIVGSTTVSLAKYMSNKGK